MKTFFGFSILAILATGLVGVSPALAKGEKEALEAAAGAWIKAYQSGDGAATAAVYAEDGMLLPPNQEPVAGREGIAAMWTELIASGAKLELENQETVVEGKLGYRLGLYTMVGADGKELDRGKYIEIWTRSGKDWVMARDMWNSNVPVSMH
jgi:uncharacterized protein (TIGR02246 family)